MLWIALALSLAGCRAQTPAYTARFTAFGGQIDLTIVGVEEAIAAQASAQIQHDFGIMQDAWQAPDASPLAHVNERLRNGRPIAAPPSILPLIRLGQDLADASENLVNPAMGKLIDLWGFRKDSSKHFAPPSSQEIRRLVKAAPRMADLHVESIRIRSDNPNLKLDFSALGRGYAIDLAIEHLRDLGIGNAMISLDGDLRAIGDRDGQPWRVPIRRAAGHGVFAIVEVRGDESVFTAARYQQNFVHEGKIYHHILDPRTGYPAKGTLAVTVIHTDAATADAAATALFVAGAEDGFRIAERMGIRYVLLVDRAGTVHMNPAMANRVQILDKDAEIKLTPLPNDPVPAG